MISLVTMRHIKETHERGAEESQRSLISDLLYTEERLIDCCDIVAGALVKYAAATGRISNISELNTDEKRKQIRALFKDKYEMLGFEAE